MKNDYSLTKIVLANMYAYGLGVNKDYEKAERLCNSVLRENRSLDTATIAYKILGYLYSLDDYKKDIGFSNKCYEMSNKLERKILKDNDFTLKLY